MKKFFATLARTSALAIAMAFVLSPLAAQAVTISPPYFDYRLNPGDTVLDVVKVFNENSNPITLYPQVENFTYTKGDEKGTPEFYPADEDRDGSGLAKWITVNNLEPVTLQPNERANIPFSVNIPKEGAQPGGHFGAILLSTTPPGEAGQGGQVGIGQVIGALVLVRVSGDVTEQASITEFGFDHPQVWYNYLPVDFFLRVENDGNTHLRPTGNLFIKNMFGQQVAAVKVNEEFGGVLPHSIRRFAFGWQNAENPAGKGDFMTELKKEWSNFGFGKYTATLVLTYGSNNQVLSDEREFTVWPWRLLLIFGAAVVIVLLLVIMLMRAYNKAVIRKYELEKAKKK